MRVLGFGEVVLRLTPPERQQLAAASVLEVHVGGCEANVMAGISGMGIQSRMLAALPEHGLGDLAVRSLRASGIEVADVRLPHRLGTYYCETGFGARPSQVVYDRADSAITHLKLADLDLDALFADCDWFYISGITLALSPSTQALAFELADEAQRRGLKLAFDVNFRSKLWDYSTAKPVLARMASRADLLLAAAADLAGLFGIALQDNTAAGLLDGWRLLAQKIGPRHFAATRRIVLSTSTNRYQGCVLLADGSSGVSREYDMEILERVGGGDAFAAGVLYAILQGETAQTAADYATAAAVLKHTLPGDHALLLPEAVRRMAANGSAVMQR